MKADTRGRRKFCTNVIVIEGNGVVSGLRNFGIVTETRLVHIAAQRSTHFSERRQDGDAAQLPGMDVAEAWILSSVYL